MKILSIKKLEHITPKGGSGTGCSEPDKLLVTCDDGTEKIIWVDIWYVDISYIKREFLKGIGQIFRAVSNIDEAYEMYVKEIAEHSCPWSVEKILNTYQNINCE